MIRAEIEDTAVNLFDDGNTYIGNLAKGKVKIDDMKDGRCRITIYPPNDYEPSFVIVDNVTEQHSIFGLYEKLKAYEGEEAKIAKKNRELEREPQG